MTDQIDTVGIISALKQANREKDAIIDRLITDSMKDRAKIAELEQAFTKMCAIMSIC